MQLTPAQKSFFAWSLIVVLLAAVLWQLSPVLTPFVVASVLAYALTPVVDWLDNIGRGRISRLLAVMVVPLLVILTVLGLLLMVILAGFYSAGLALFAPHVGVLIALPVITVLLFAIRRIKTQYLSSALYRG